MKLNASHIITIIISLTTKIITITLFLSPLPSLTSSQTCSKTCGNIPIKYPFGTGPGCGDPRFEPYVTCSNNQQQELTLTTHTGCYPITSIDYTSQVIYISDPTMSTCDCTQPSKGFGLDWDAPFSFSEDSVFALLGCSSTSSTASYNNDGNNNTFPTCDSKGGSICSLLYSCEAMSRLSLPISSCCIYAPVDLGPSFEMDLEKLRCSSYSALHGYSSVDLDGWRYGIGLKYKFSYDNEYPENCASCEKSNGVCGYDVVGPDKPFHCSCVGGLNTTTDCFYGRAWSYGSRVDLPWNAGVFPVFHLAWLVGLAFL